MVSFRVVQVGQIRRSKWAKLDERTQELAFTTLTNDEIIKRFRPKLRQHWKRNKPPSLHALRACLNRIRRYHSFLPSAAIPKKAVNP